MRSAATWNVAVGTGASSSIEQGLFLLHALAEIGIGEAGRCDQINRPREQRFKLLAQREVRGRIFPRRPLAQVDEEIEVARRAATRAGAEELQPTNAEAGADRSDLHAARFDLTRQYGAHG